MTCQQLSVSVHKSVIQLKGMCAIENVQSDHKGLLGTYLSLLAFCRAPPLKEHKQQSLGKNTNT